MSEFEENERRSVRAIARDRLVIRAIAEGPVTVARLAERLGLKRAEVYGSISPLRKGEYVEKEKTSSRTPMWKVTERGAAYVAYVATLSDQPELPPAPPEPEPEPVPVPDAAPQPEPQPVG